MIREANEYYSWDKKHVVIKVAMRGDGSGLEVISELHSQGIPVNATVMMTTTQAVLAAKAGADYTSLFYNRIKDSGEDPILVVRRTREIFDRTGMRAKIIVGSIRHPYDVMDAASAGAHILTVPYKIMVQLPFHAKSEQTIEEFDKAWQEFVSVKQKQVVAETIQRA